MKQILSLIIPVFFFVANVQAQKEVKVAEIKTSAVCGMCKTTLENGIIYEKGVKKSELNVDTKVFKIWYREDKTDIDQLRIAVSNLGYDADSVMANPKAYERLDACCKKDAHQSDHEKH